jgi:predicted transcriptional regulator of viral defense system
MCSSIEQILTIAKANNGMVTTSQVTSAGIARKFLQDCLEQNLLQKASRGVYVLPGVWEDELYILHHKYPKGIFSHETALYLLGYSDRAPFSYTMTFPQGYNITAAKNNGVVSRLVKKNNHILGKITLPSPSNNLIPVYNIERTICDIFKIRSSIDEQIFRPAIKAYARSNHRNLPMLFEYANKFNITKQIQTYLEILL